MPFNGANSFVALPPPRYPAVPGETIRAAYFNAVLDDVFQGLSNCLTRDGQGNPTSNLPMGGKKHTGVANGTASDDYAAYGQLTAGLSAITTRLQGRLQDIREFAGIVADGVTDDRVAFMAAIQTAIAGGYGIWIPDGVWIKLNFPTNLSQIYISGQLSICGPNGNHCGFVLEKQVDKVGAVHDPLFCIGVPSKGADVQSWTGVLSGVGFVLNNTCKTFETCLHIYQMNNAIIRDCVYDGRAKTFTASQFAGGFIRGNVQALWAVGQTRNTNNLIWHNTAYASAYTLNNESISFTWLDDSLIAFNTVVGFSDDFALHEGINTRIVFNVIKSLSGRLYVEDATDVDLLYNSIEHMKDPSNAYIVGSGIQMIRISHTSTYAVNTTAPANNNIRIEGNKIKIPSGSYNSACIYVENVQKGCIIKNNVADCQGTGTLDATTSFISVVQAAATGWTGPAGNPDYSFGSVRLREITIAGNVAVGSGWKATECGVGISAATSSANVIGPIHVYDNLAGSYYMQYACIEFAPSNRALLISTDPYKNVSFIATMARSVPAFSVTLTAGMLLEVTHHPLGSPATIADSANPGFFAICGGSVRGVRLNLNAAPIGTSPPTNCFVRLYKNGVQLGSDAFFVYVGGTTNCVICEANFNGISTTFSTGDYITIQMYFTAGQTVALTGTFELHVIYGNP